MSRLIFLLALFVTVVLACGSTGGDATPSDGGPADVVADGSTDVSHDTPTETNDTLADVPAGTRPGLRLEGGTIVDYQGSRRADVRIERGRITHVGQSVPSHPDDEVLDVAGRFVAPSLVDVHVHLGYAGTLTVVGDTLEDNLRGQLSHGVGAVFDVGGPLAIFELRDAVARGAIVGPHIRATGPFLTTAGSHPCESIVDRDLCTFVDEESATTVASQRRDVGADAIKIALADADSTPWPAPRMPLATLAAIANVGHPLVVHSNSNRDVLEAHQHGAWFFAHTVFVEPISNASLDAVATSGGMATTVSAFAGVGRIAGGDLDPQDGSLVLSETVRADWQAAQDDPGILLEGWRETSAIWATQTRDNLRASVERGVSVFPGSDAGYYFVPHGRALHDELDELRDAGLSPTDVLVRATRDARGLLGLDGGEIAEGQPADLVVVEEDPLIDTTAWRALVWVIVGGDARSPGQWAQADLMPAGSAEIGQVCLASDDCRGGARCDPFEHRCRQACETPYVTAGACGVTSWCLPASGVRDAGDVSGVCHEESACELLGNDCTPAYYDLTCLPLDIDTNTCWPTGPRTVGESCSWHQPDLRCQPDLFCSWIDNTCYQMCRDGGCPDGQACVAQVAGDGSTWFSLCL